MQVNKTGLLPVRLREPAVATRLLPNIDEDLEIDEEFRMPLSARPKKKTMHTSDKLQTKLKRVIGLKDGRRNKSVQSYNSLYRDTLQRPSLHKPSQLPTLAPIVHSRNKSVLDQILTRQDDFSKAYFMDLHRLDRARQKEEGEEENADFEFPTVRVGAWQVIGLIKGEHILLKGTHKDGRACIKKYDYEKVYGKVRKDYQSWVDSKFCFEA